jgi:predicted  nucleic acid-binding Zn-ribbon protein
MASSRRPEGNPGSGHGKARTWRSKRTAALAKKQKDEVLRRIPQLELHQAYGDERAEHDATKATASRLRLEHNDLVKRLDEAETAVAATESRAWENEKQIIALQETLSKSRMGAQNSEAWIELIADENQRLEEANARMVARTAVREDELKQEIGLMEERARQLERSLSIAYKDVEEYGVLFQKHTEDWAELGRFLDEHMSEDNEQIQELRRSVMEYSNSMDHFHGEINKLFQAAEVRIARNRLRRPKTERSTGLEGSQWDNQISRPGFGLSSENLEHSLMLVESPDSDSDSSSSQGNSTYTVLPCEEHIESHGPYTPPRKIGHARRDPVPTNSSDAELEFANDELKSLESLESLAPLVDDIQNGLAMFNAIEKRPSLESACGDEANPGLNLKRDHDQICMYKHFVQDWEENSFISQNLDGNPYSNEGRGRFWEQMLADGISAPEDTESQSSLGESSSILSSTDPTSLSGSRLSNLRFRSWNRVQGRQSPLQIVQERRGIDKSRLESLPVHYESLSNGYIPPLNTSRKRIRLAPPPPDPISGADDEAHDLSAANSDVGVQANIEATACEVPQGTSDTWILNDDGTQRSFTVDQRQRSSIVGTNESKGIQTDDDPLLARLDNLAASSSQALVVWAKGPLSPRGKLRSLSVGDLPRIIAAKEGTSLERMPGSWPREIISHADVKPIKASEIADAALQMFKASVENVIPVGIKFLHLLDPAHPNCIVYPGLMVLWLWQIYEEHVEWKRWDRTNERYFAQQLRNRYASQAGWVDSMGFGLSQWLAFDRSSFG